MKKLFFLLFFITSGFTTVSSQKLFDKIKEGDYLYLKAELMKDVSYDQLITIRDVVNEDTAFSAIYSVYQWSAFSDCIPCLEQLMYQKEKLQTYFNVPNEINQCLAPAVSRNNIKMIDYLVGLGADVNARCVSCYNMAPVQVAIDNLNYEIFFFLLTKKVNLNVKDYKGHNLYHSLLITYFDGLKLDTIPGINTFKPNEVAIAIMDTLEKKGVDINAKNNIGETPLMFAASTNNMSIYQYVKTKTNPINLSDTASIVSLLNYSMAYDVTKKNDSIYINLFDYIIHQEHIELTKELAQAYDLTGIPMLINAAVEENYPVLKKLLALKVDVNQTDADGYTAIECAVNNADPLICAELLNNGAIVTKDDLAKAKKYFKGDNTLIKAFQRNLEK